MKQTKTLRNNTFYMLATTIAMLLISVLTFRKEVGFQRKALLLVLSMTVFPLAAQKGTFSPYSFARLGEVSFRGNQVNRLMGGLDIYVDSIHANINNPASYGRLKLTTYSVGVNYKSNTIASNEASEKLTTASLDYLTVAIPAGKFGFSFGLLPYSSLGYKTESINEDVTPNVIDRHEGNGGLNQAFFSLGIPIVKSLTIGATLNYNFGSLNYRTFQIVEAVERSSTLENESSISGLNYQFVAHLNIPFGKQGKLQAMYSFSPEATLTSNNSRLLYTQLLNGGTITDVEEVNLSDKGLDKTVLNFSKTVRYGLGIGKEKKWFLGIQQNFIHSANFGNSFVQLDNLTYEDGSQISVGGFYIPNYASLTSYFKRIVYRFGFRSEKTGIVLNGNSIKENGISFGIGLPISGFSNANIGLEVGKRGEKTAGLVQENYWNLRIGLSLNDRWFIKRKFN